MESIECDFCIIGAGVIGLAVAEALTRCRSDISVLVFERHGHFGQEASSRNSEVIHAGIYYTPGSLKAKSCVRGRDLLYSFCRDHDVPYARCGKMIFARNAEQSAALERIRQTAHANGVALEAMTAARASEAIGLPIASALWSSASGIVDSHALMKCLYESALNCGAGVFFRHQFHEFAGFVGDRAHFTILDPDGGALAISSRVFINAAGLGAARIARAVSSQDQWSIRACRGRYFSLSSRWTNRYKSLIYPLPDPRGGLGTHLTIDLSGRARLGPDVDWPGGSLEPDSWLHYKFDDDVAALRESFFAAGRVFLPGLRADDLEPDYVGVRAKLFKNGEPYPEFVIDSDPSGAIHLLGLESPGLTSALAIAQDVIALLAEQGQI